jgi:transposase
MVDQSEALPRDIDALHALIRAERSALASAMAARDAAFAERDQLAVRNAKLEHILAEIRRAHFGRKSERISDDQLALALEDLEAELAKDEAKDDKADPALKLVRSHKRRTSRALKFDHLPHEEVVIEPQSKICPCCGGALHVIGEDTSQRLDKIPAKIRVIVTRRPKYACRTCTDGVVQAPVGAPSDGACAPAPRRGRVAD